MANLTETFGSTFTVADATLGAFTEATGQLTVAEPVAGYSAWQTANAPGQTVDQDHDGDGVKNGIEYFMGETGTGFTALPALNASNTITWTMGDAYTGSYGTDYQIQTSSDLTTWDPVLVTDVTITPGTSVSYTLVNNGTLALSSTGGLTFKIGTDDVNNQITGTGTVSLDGLFSFDLSAASTTINDSWNIVDVGTLTESYGSNFAVSGFTLNGGGVLWNGSANGASYQFSETTGVLTVIPEPTVALLGGLGMLTLLRRRRAY